MNILLMRKNPADFRVLESHNSQSYEVLGVVQNFQYPPLKPLRMGFTV